MNSATPPPPKNADAFRLVHLSDPHLSRLDNIALRELCNKRLLGYLSWHLRRKNIHHPGVLSTLQNDVLASKPDHIAVTGDLTQLGTADECRQARDWLQNLGSVDFVSLVPGNHDCYSHADWYNTIGLWADYMRSDQAPNDTIPGFPMQRRRGHVLFFGLSTAVPTGPFLATGKIGADQLALLTKMLDANSDEPVFRVLLLHHAPVPGAAGHRRRLKDARALCEILASRPVDLVLHGHAHCAVADSIQSTADPVPVYGTASASANLEAYDKRAGYNIFDIQRGGSGWEIAVTTRTLAHNGREFVVTRQTRLRRA